MDEKRTHSHPDDCVTCWLCDERRGTCKEWRDRMDARVSGIEKYMVENTQKILKRAARNGWATVGTLITVLLAVLAFFFSDVYRHVNKVDEGKLVQAIEKMIDQKVGERIAPPPSPNH